MEKYNPTPGDFKKGEEMLTPEQAKNVAKREEIMENEEELREELELKNDKGEIIKSKNVKEIFNLLKKGYCDVTSEANDVLTIFNKDVKRELYLDKIRKNFELNENRELLYLKDGHESWIEKINNYQFNVESYSIDSGHAGTCLDYDINTTKDEIKQRLMGRIELGYSKRAHAMPKILAVFEAVFFCGKKRSRSNWFFNKEIRRSSKFFY